MSWSRRILLKKVLIFSFLFAVISHSAANAAELQIKPGNIIHITVLGYPELSKKVIVRKDGSTDYPLLAEIPIDGMTVRQLHEVLQPILARFVERPKLFISIGEHFQLEVNVQGQVENPGRYTVQGPVSLQGVLAIAGGTGSLADLRKVTIIKRDISENNEQYVDLYHYLLHRDEYTLPEISDGDIIFVPMVSSTSTVQVMGSVQKPGAYIPVRDENLSDMINMAGGASYSANTNYILHITNDKGRYRTDRIRLKSLIQSGRIEEIPLAHPGDIIVVKSLHRWEDLSWWVGILRDITLVLSSLVILSRL